MTYFNFKLISQYARLSKQHLLSSVSNRLNKELVKPDITLFPKLHHLCLQLIQKRQMCGKSGFQIKKLHQRYC